MSSPIPMEPQEVVAVAPLWQRKNVRLGAAGGAAIIVLLVALFAAGVIGGPSYPHAWCASLLAELHAKGSTEQSFDNTVSQIQQQDHAPVGQLMSDVGSYDAAESAVQNGSNLSVMGNLGAAGVALNAVAADLKTLNRDCAQPARAYEKDYF